MPPLWCDPCWTKHHTRTPATWDVDGDLYCNDCKERSGYEKHEGKRLGRADAVASANTTNLVVSAGSVPQKAAKAHAVVVPIPDRLKNAIAIKPSDPLSVALDRTFGPLNDADEQVQPVKDEGDSNPSATNDYSVAVVNPPPAPAEQQEKGTSMPRKVEIDWIMYDKLSAEGKTCDAIATLLGVGRSTLDRYVATRNGISRKQPAPAPGGTCSVAGCTNELRADNQSGICTEHQKRSGKPSGRPRRPTPANGRDYDKLAQMATICVPASALDAWWLKLTIDERADIFSDYISRAEA